MTDTRYMNAVRLLRLSVTPVVFLACTTACQQGAVVGPYPSTSVNATTPPRDVSPSPTASAAGTMTSAPTATPTASSGGNSPSPTPAATASASNVGALVISPNPVNFGITSVLGSTQTATISQQNYSGPFTLAANPIVCSNGITNIPVTAAISRSTLTIALGLLGVTGSCTIAVEGAPGTSGSEVVNLTVPLTPPASTGVLTFTPNPVDFDVLNGVTGTTATSIVSETGYFGAFALTSNPVSCPFNLLPLTKLGATISGNVVTLTTGLLNANLLGSCSVTVEDGNGNTGAITVNFQLLK